jgi:catechol 2,3-dioxygenase-like lactoylglutathione lyase family enzyme
VSRVQLALNVTDLDAAVDFYTTLFGTEPAKRRPGYANFAIAEPPLKLVLIEGPAGRADGVSGALNHLGIEVETPEEVEDASLRLAEAGLTPRVQESTTCCYAVQDKAWVSDPDGAPWEVYTVLADATDATDMGCSTETCGPAVGIPVTAGVASAADSGAPAASNCC